MRAATFCPGASCGSDSLAQVFRGICPTGLHRNRESGVTNFVGYQVSKYDLPLNRLNMTGTLMVLMVYYSDVIGEHMGPNPSLTK